MRSDTRIGSRIAGHPDGSSVIEVGPARQRYWRAWLVLILLMLGSRPAHADCQTNQNSTLIDLSTWSVVQYDVFTQPAATWTLSQSNTVALQSVNADASILLSPFILQDDQIQGSWLVSTNEDDDFMGFVFGYQDDHHFYLFDWKQFNQFNTSWGSSYQGMSVKAIHADTPLAGVDLGATTPIDTNRVTLLYHNDISWEHFTNYQFHLEFHPGHFTIRVMEGAQVLDTIAIDDATYTSGRFGFYNFSQSMVRYAGFTRGLLAPRPDISVEDNSVLEGNTGTTNLNFSVNLSFSNCQPVMVDYSITPGTATPGVDYTAAAFGTLVFAPGETNRRVTISVIGDLLTEPDETLFLCLSNPVNAALPARCAVGTILNDDGNQPPTVQIFRPADGGVIYTPPGLVIIEANAWDIDGYVDHVDFFAGGMWLGSVTNAAWTVRWTNNVPGDYVLTAIATDNQGATGTSAPVHITIRACDPNLSATPLDSQTRCLCDEVQFSTTVSSSEPVSFVWKANGIVLPGQTNRTLLLQSLKPGQAGTYTVEISTACATTSRSATLTLRGAGNQNPVPFTNSTRIDIIDHAIAAPYHSDITVECVPGPVKHIAVTLDGLTHTAPDDVDILLVGPGFQTVRLMSDCGGFSLQKITNVILTFTDTATTPLPDSTRIASGVYRPTNYGDPDAFTPPAPQTVPAADFAPFLSSDPNGTWSLYVVDDTGGDSGVIMRGWSLAVEWEDTTPRLTSPTLLPDGRFQTTLEGLPHMTHVVEASEDLARWVPISTNTFAAPAVIIFDSPPEGEPYRFYRAIRCP